MKFNWRCLHENSFIFVILICFIALLITLPDIDIKGGKTFLYIAESVIILICGLYTAYYIRKGKIYYEYVYIPKEDLKISTYSNMVIIIYNNVAWTFTYKADKIGVLKKIKAVQYYNIKKNPIDLYLIPYTQLKKKGKNESPT